MIARGGAIGTGGIHMTLDFGIPLVPAVTALYFVMQKRRGGTGRSVRATRRTA